MSLWKFGRIYTRRRFNMLGLITIFAGIMLLVITIYQYWGTFSFLYGSVSTSGRVVDCRINTFNSNCIPIINFKTRTDQQVTIRPDVNNSPYHIGDSITVWYHPDNPADGRIDVGIVDLLKLLYLPLAALFALVGGLVFLWIGGAIDLPGLIIKIKKRRALRAEASFSKSRVEALASLTSAQPQTKRKKTTRKRGRRR